MATTPVITPGESHRQRSLVGRKESDTTEQLTHKARQTALPLLRLDQDGAPWPCLHTCPEPDPGVWQELPQTSPTEVFSTLALLVEKEKVFMCKATYLCSSSR